MDGASKRSPAIAVPITVKMPDPMTAPMPRAVSDHGPSVFFSACSGSSELRMSLSIDLRASSWLASSDLLVAGIQRQDTTANMSQGSEIGISTALSSAGRSGP
jgi:hypothetical protein